MPTVELQSSDLRVFKVDAEVAKKSETIKAMLDQLDADETLGESVPVMKVKGNILSKVLEWCEHHVNDNYVEEPRQASELPLPSDIIDEWDRNFMNVNMGVKFELILAANYLNIKGLLDLASKSIANDIKGKSPSEMRQIFNLNPPINPRILQTLNVNLR